MIILLLRPWGQSVVPMEVAVPVVVPDPPETGVPAVSDSSAILDGGVGETEDVAAVAVVTEEEAVVNDDEVTVVNVPVAEEVQAPSVPVVPVVPVTASGPSVVSAASPEVASASSCVASSRFFTPDLRREFSSEYRESLCKWAVDAAYACSNGGSKVVKIVPLDTPDKVRITMESGGTRIVRVDQVRVSRVDTSESEEEWAQFILKVKDDPSYRISFKGSIVDKVSPTYDGSFLDVVFSDHIKSESRKLPAKSLWVKKIALSNSSCANASNCVNNVLVGDGVVMVSRSGSRSVVPTAAVLAAELIKRTTPPSVVGVPKCRKKL